MRVLAAMSGGVDSAVAAARAVDAGHDVVGVHLALSADARHAAGGRAWLLLASRTPRDARRAADVLGIPFYVWDFAARFTADVVDDFVAEYAAGRTPNPCLRCNEKIKFAALLDRAIALGFDAVCTGHYARPRPTGELRRAVDAGKDQSYVLAVLTPRPARGTRCSRSATPRRPRSAPRPPSAGCAWRTSPTATTSASSPPATPRRSSPTGIGSPAGRDRGRRDRRRARPATTACTASPSGSARASASPRPAADGRPRYVLGIEPVSGTVRVGPAAALDVRAIEAERPVWTRRAAGPGPVRLRRAGARPRRLAPAVAEPVPDGVRVELDRAAARGGARARRWRSTARTPRATWCWAAPPSPPRREWIRVPGHSYPLTGPIRPPSPR